MPTCLCSPGKKCKACDAQRAVDRQYVGIIAVGSTCLSLAVVAWCSPTAALVAFVWVLIAVVVYVNR